MKKSNPFLGQAIALTIAAMALSCSGDQVMNPVQSTARGAARVSAVSRIAGDTLAVVRYADSSFVIFREFSPGDIAIQHSHRLSSRPGEPNARRVASAQISSKLEILSNQDQSLVAMYKALVTTPDAHVLSRLTDAQARLVQAKAEQQVTPPAELDSLSGYTETGTQDVVYGCTPDYFQDNYGAQWFIDNYINVNKFRRYQTNQAKAGYQTQNNSWTKIVAMAPDYGTGIHFRGERLECYGFLCINTHWVDRWSFDISARGVEEWYIYSNKTYRSRAKGYDPCQRVHIGACNDRNSPSPISPNHI
jgi:hypothetical protein